MTQWGRVMAENFKLQNLRLGSNCAKFKFTKYVQLSV